MNVKDVIINALVLFFSRHAAVLTERYIRIYGQLDKDRGFLARFF